MTYDFNQHLVHGLKASVAKSTKGVKAYFINAMDRKIIDVTDDLIAQEYHSKSFFLGSTGAVKGSDILTDNAIELMKDFLNCDEADMGARQEGPCIFTVNTSDDLDLPFGFSFPGLPHLVHGNGVIMVDEAFLEAGLKIYLDKIGPPKSEVDRLARAKMASLDLANKIGFFRSQQVEQDGKAMTAIQPDPNCFSYLTAKGIEDDVKIKLVRHDARKGDVWDADMREGLAPENAIDVTGKVKELSKNMAKNFKKS